MTRFAFSLPAIALTLLAFLSTESTSQAQYYNGYGYNTPYGGSYGNNYGGYGTPYNYYLANRASIDTKRL